MSSFIYSGVDPGKNGAIASIDQDGAVLKISRFKHALAVCVIWNASNAYTRHR